MKYPAIICATLLSLMGSAYAADPAPVAAGGNGGVWTKEQIQKLCYLRAEKDRQNPKRYDICMKRNGDKIGKQKQPQAVAELNEADKMIAAKAAAKKATAAHK